MAGPPRRLNALLIALLATFGVGLTFVVLILTGIAAGVLPHEIAGLLLLVLLVGDLWAALGLRRLDGRPAQRIVVALVALGVAASLGALLAGSQLPPLLGGLPLVPLLAMLLATADAARLTRRIGRSAVSV